MVKPSSPPSATIETLDDFERSKFYYDHTLRKDDGWKLNTGAYNNSYKTSSLSDVLTKYPGEAAPALNQDFHVRDRIYLNNGDFIFFAVPLKNFKRDGGVLVPFSYDWDSGNSAYMVDQRGYLVKTVQHYLVFGPERLPQNLLK